MLSKRTVLSQIEIPADGAVQIRLSKQVVEDGNVLSSEYHRTAVPHDGDVDAQMALVNDNLRHMGCAPVDDETLARIRKIVNAVR